MTDVAPEVEVAGGLLGVRRAGVFWARGGTRGRGWCAAGLGIGGYGPRRARCRGCVGTHVLLPEIALLRR
jgi:hypothetical protein